MLCLALPLGALVAVSLGATIVDSGGDGELNSGLFLESSLGRSTYQYVVERDVKRRRPF